MNEAPVSVVICTYNGEKYISEQVDSICRQSYTNLEVVIVDDSSTDGTYPLLQEKAAADPRIKLFRNTETLGITGNFEKALLLTCNELIAIADQDDIWKETKVEELVRALESSPDVLLVHSMSARFEEFGKFHKSSLAKVNYDAGKDIRNFFLMNFINGHNMMFRRKLLDLALPFPKKVLYDWWLAAVAASNGEISSLQEVHVWHRVHETNATGKAKMRVPMHQLAQLVIPELMKIASIRPQELSFAHKLLRHFGALQHQRFSLPLFLFLLRHSPLLFGHKKRKFPWLSYTKHSLRLATAQAKV